MIEETIAKIQSLGFKINNLFQLDEGGWQSNLRRVDGDTHEWGRGKTPQAALEAALETAKRSRGAPGGKKTATYIPPTKPRPSAPVLVFEDLFPAANSVITQKELALEFLAKLDLKPNNVD